MESALIKTTGELLSMFGLVTEFQEESRCDFLTSAYEVNILVGLANGLRGNLVLGCDTELALKLASTMMGQIKISKLDALAKSALGELTNMIVGNTISNLTSDSIIDFSPPTIIHGEDIFLMIGRVSCYKLIFNLGESRFMIAYAIE